MKRRLLVVGVLVLLAGLGAIVWRLTDPPPPGHLLRYGLAPGCEPTGRTLTVEGVTFVEIGPGVFRMGSTALAERGDLLGQLGEVFDLSWGERPEPSGEMPVHWVEFRRGFWIAETEVTNAQYERFDPAHERAECSQGDSDPVVMVSWEDAKDYCAWLGERAARPIRLPGEAEWECACRAGGQGEFTFGDDSAPLSEYAWFDENSGKRAQTVATKRPNRWGLFDLHGNVWEWCEDAWHHSYDGAPADGSPWTEGGTGWGQNLPDRLIRGGCFEDPAVICRSPYRYNIHPESRGGDLGFRPAMVVPDE